MGRPKKEVEAKEAKLRCNVVNLDDYIAKVKDLTGQARIKQALAILYSENKVVDTLVAKGGLYFVVE